MTKKIKFMCTAFRDGFQSAYGARVLTNDFLPAVEAGEMRVSPILKQVEGHVFSHSTFTVMKMPLR